MIHVLTMPHTPARLRVPASCPHCHAKDTIKMQTSIHGQSLIPEWHCTACKAEWPVRRKDEQKSA